MRPFAEESGITTQQRAARGQRAGRRDRKSEEKQSRSAGERGRIDAVAGMGLSRAGA